MVHFQSGHLDELHQGALFHHRFDFLCISEIKEDQTFTHDKKKVWKCVVHQRPDRMCQVVCQCATHNLTHTCLLTHKETGC